MCESFFLAPHKFYIGFRYVNPLTEDTLDQMERYLPLDFSYADFSYVDLLLTRFFMS